MSESPSKHLLQNLDLFHCPACHGELVVDDGLCCAACGSRYPIEKGIPHLYVPDEDAPRQEAVTRDVQAFYEETPFPNYEDTDSIEDLIEKAGAGRFARLMNDQLPFNARVLEVGCGTGQLTNYLGVAQRTMFGADMTLNSLQLANDFRSRHGLDRVGFYQMNLYRPTFREGSFDVVLCNGVLCAVADPEAGFRSVAKLVKPGGYLLVGTYNSFGRLITDARRVLIRLFGERMKVLDPRLRGDHLGEARHRAWFQDQYRHPSESKQSFGRLLRWFDAAGFEFMYGVPNPKAFRDFSERDDIFAPHPRGNVLDHAIVQTQLFFQGSYEGGFFTMIGRRV